MQLFYNAKLHQDSKSLTFDKKESRHIIKSLRKINGDKLNITNGKGFLFTSKIIDANPNQCQVKIQEATYHKGHIYEIHIAIAPTKRNERFEWFLEKATEIGISKITPIICKNSERKTVKLNRFERVLQSAMKQSLQYHLPQLEAPISFAEFIRQKFSGQQFIAHCEEVEKSFLINQVKAQNSVTLLIGPEGDFSTTEINQALAQNFIPVSLGNNRLRTETAGVAGCHSVALANLRTLIK